MSTDQVILVNSQDQAVGVMDKVAAHQGEGQRHQAISVFLFRQHADTGEWETLLQQRSVHKITAQLKWANTCCGNLRPGETHLECSYRRLQEELGINQTKLTRDLRQVATFEYRAELGNGWSEWEIDHVFTGQFQGNPQPNDQEVAGYQWVDWHDLVSAVNQKKYLTWQETTTHTWEELHGKTPYVTVTLADITHELAPWTVFMLQDPQLVAVLPPTDLRD